MARRRAIALPQVALTSLWAHRVRQEQERQFGGSRWKETGYVFTSSIGTPLDPREPNVEFAKLVKAAGLRRIRVHDVRHTCASLLLAQGVSYKAIQAILGHSDIRITLNLYSHLYPEAKREAADKMDALLGAEPVAQVPEAAKPN